VARHSSARQAKEVDFQVRLGQDVSRLKIPTFLRILARLQSFWPSEALEVSTVRWATKD
jgi:hypothetical protein